MIRKVLNDIFEHQHLGIGIVFHLVKNLYFSLSKLANLQPNQLFQKTSFHRTKLPKDCTTPWIETQSPEAGTSHTLVCQEDIEEVMSQNQTAVETFAIVPISKWRSMEKRLKNFEGEKAEPAAEPPQPPTPTGLK